VLLVGEEPLLPSRVAAVIVAPAGAKALVAPAAVAIVAAIAATAVAFSGCGIDVKQATRAREVQELIASEIEAANRKFARVEQVKKFRLLENQLTAEDEELTPTMKLKRSFVQKKYAEMIDGMYRD
jgi:long-subunit acyl-CoA synthetase (AMP-forming)